MPRRAKARAECYAALREVLKSETRAYFLRHPERIDEERTRTGLASINVMLQKMFDVLENYEINYLEERAGK